MVVETQTFKQNAVEVTKPSLSSAFSKEAGLDADGEKPDAPALSDMFKTAGGNENVRQLALQSGSVDGVQKNGASLTKHYNEMRARGAKQGGNKSDIALYVLLDQINALEGQLAAQYGENFAEDLFSDLKEQGLIEDDEYDRIMAIEDPDERRQAIAAAIQKGLDDGTIKAGDLKDHPWAQDWLDLHKEAVAKRDYKAQKVLDGEEQGRDVGVDVADEAANSGDQSKAQLVAKLIDSESENKANEANSTASQSLDVFSV